MKDRVDVAHLMPTDKSRGTPPRERAKRFTSQGGTKQSTSTLPDQPQASHPHTYRRFKCETPRRFTCTSPAGLDGVSVRKGTILDLMVLGKC